MPSDKGEKPESSEKGGDKRDWSGSGIGRGGGQVNEAVGGRGPGGGNAGSAPGNKYLDDPYADDPKRRAPRHDDVGRRYDPRDQRIDRPEAQDPGNRQERKRLEMPPVAASAGSSGGGANPPPSPATKRGSELESKLKTKL